MKICHVYCFIPSKVAEERIGNIRIVRAFAQEAKECQAYNTKVDGVLRLAYKEALARGLFFGSVSVFAIFICTGSCV